MSARGKTDELFDGIRHYVTCSDRPAQKNVELRLRVRPYYARRGSQESLLETGARVLGVVA